MSAGKLQRNPSTGKIKRNPTTGKLRRNTASNTKCCCTSASQVCFGCNRTATARIVFSGITLCSCVLLGGERVSGILDITGTWDLPLVLASPFCAWELTYTPGTNVAVNWTSAACNIIKQACTSLIFRLEEGASDAYNLTVQATPNFTAIGATNYMFFKTGYTDAVACGTSITIPALITSCSVGGGNLHLSHSGQGVVTWV